MLRVKGICMLLVALCGTPVFSAPHGCPANCPELLTHHVRKLLEELKEKANLTESYIKAMRGSNSTSLTGLPDCTFPQGTNATTIFLVVSAFNELFKQKNSSYPEFFRTEFFTDQTLCGLSSISTSASPTPITYKKHASLFEQHMQLYYAFEYYEQCMKTLAKRCKNMQPNPFVSVSRG